MIKKLKYMVFLVSVAANLLFPSYWLWLLLIIEAASMFKVSGKSILVAAFILTATGAFLAIPGLEISGHILRIGLVFWIVGYFLNLVEIAIGSRKNDKET